MSIVGSIDQLSPSGATGWIHNTVTQEPLIVQAVLDGQVIGESVADGDRPDLADAGLGDGRCGFFLPFGFQLDETLLPFVSIRPFGGSVELPRTSITGYVDAYRALRARHPGAGWHRSILGGLWTDRLDARRRLAGKLATGAVAAALEPVLGDFMEQGFVPVDTAAAALPAKLVAEAGNQPGGLLASGSGAALLKALPDAVFQPRLCEVARAIFEDNPVAAATVVVHGNGSFTQATGIEALPSPAECAALVFTLGDAKGWLDVVSGSHAMPEFMPDGTSRWSVGARLPPRLAETMGGSMEILALPPGQAYLLAPSALFRLRVGASETALAMLLTPARQTPLRFLKDEMLSISHPSGALLVA